MSSQKHQKNRKTAPLHATLSAWAFGDFVVDLCDGRLTREGRPVAIAPKALEALGLLVTRHGQLVTRSELLEALWPDTYVGDGSLTSLIWTVRRALGGADLWIETVPKRGYRFVGDAEERPVVRGTDGPFALRPVSIEVYRLCLEGRHLCHRWPTAAFHQSRNCFERALRLDPMCADAHVGLALYYGIGAAMGLLPPVDGWRRFQVALAAARRIDDTRAENLNGVAAMHLYLHRNWEAAEGAFLQALAQNPDDAETRNHYGFSLALFGRFEEAMAAIERAIALDPLSVRFRWNLGRVLYQAGRYDDAIEQGLNTLALDRTYLHGHALIGDAHEQKGELRDALRHWNESGIGREHAGGATFERTWRARLGALSRRMAAGDFVPSMDVARVHARLGNREATFRWLAKAVREPSRLVLELPVDPLFTRFRGLPRFDVITAALPTAPAPRNASHAQGGQNIQTAT